jgi:hypothetical protein
MGMCSAVADPVGDVPELAGHSLVAVDLMNSSSTGHRMCVTASWSLWTAQTLGHH